MRPTFIIFVLGLISATYGFYQLPIFPDKIWALMGIGVGIFLIGMIFFGLRLKAVLTLFIFLLGCIIGFQNSFWQSFYVSKLPAQIFNHTIQVTGKVIGLPERSQTQWHHHPQTKVKFELVLSKIKDKSKTWQWYLNAPKIKLNAYNLSKIPRPGQILTLKVKLKPNHASLNPGGFDYETYLFQKHWVATGYVKQWIRLEQSGSVGVRDRLDQALRKAFAHSDDQAFYLALLVGDKSLISAEQWQLLQRTGTIHLMAISGLHVGILAGLGFALFGFLWQQACRFSTWARRTPKVYFASMGAVLFAMAYLVLAGFAIPTQRAGLMVMAVVVFVVMKRQFQPWTALALAAFLVVLWEPTSVLSPGFWLSFTAVALIFAILFHPCIRPLKNWQKVIWVQVGLSIGLMPWVAYYYQQVPLYEVFANFVAVPLVSFLALPLLFLMVLVYPVSEGLNHFLLVLSDSIWSFLIYFLQILSNLETAVLPLSISLWQVVLAYLVIFGFLRFSAKQSFKLTKIMVILGGLGVVMWWPSKWPVSKTTQMTLLDVGQGLAMVVTTPNHTLVYDTGGYWSPKLDGGNLAVLPYLKYLHRNKIDLMVVSHSDIDHAGGAARILANLPVKQAISGQPQLLNQRTKSQKFTPCIAGQSWQFDDLSVRVLSPLKTPPFPKSDNDHSCVVSFSIQGQQILVTGDLSQGYEKRLVQKESQSLASQILVAGHHGSQTATSELFLKTVQPKIVLFSAGYLNRYHFPNQPVIQRVNQQGIVWWNTACEGAMSFVWLKGRWQKQESYRQSYAKWYHHRCRLREKGRLFQ